MVRRVSRPALLLPLLLAVLLLTVILLPGCRFFTASFFPGYLAQVEKSYDLESEIDGFLAGVGSADYALRPSVFVLTASTGEDYGGLLLELDGIPDRLLIMAGPSGGVQAYSSASTGWGQMHLLDASAPIRRFVVGQYQFIPGDLSTIGINSAIPGDNHGFSNGTYNYSLWTQDYATIGYKQHASDWLETASTTGSVGFAGSFELRGVYYDPEAVTGREVALVVFDYGNNRVLVVFVPFAAFPTSVGSLSTYPYAQFSDVDASRVVYTHKGIVVAQDREAVLMDFSGKETGKRLSLGEGGDKSFSFDIEGDVFYIFDPESKTLYRGKTGW
jgi:hypothetical protein